MEGQKESSQGGCIQSYEHVLFRKEKNLVECNHGHAHIKYNYSLLMKHEYIVSTWMFYGAYGL
jgi:hypothetical protein